MPRARYCVFEPFCLDLLDERLWKSDANIPLGYKAFCVLAYWLGTRSNSWRRTISCQRSGPM